jgi:hypothetical protein
VGQFEFSFPLTFLFLPGRYAHDLHGVADYVSWALVAVVGAFGPSGIDNTPARQ